MLFYFVRHGETEFNRLQRLAGGGLDHCLNPQGHAQAEALARDLAQHVPHKVHRIISSHMTRARETAEYLSKMLNLPLDVMPEFREWELGEWEGLPSAEYIAQILGEGEPAEGETRKGFYSRVENAWKSVHSDDQPYILVSHGAVWLAMQDLLKIPRFKINNCALVKVQGPEWRAEILR